jgi:hypothetical protein
MSALTLLVLRFGFLLLLWAFVFAVVYALRTDLFGQRVRRLPPVAAVSAQTEAFSALVPATSDAPSSTAATRLVITSGPKEGLEMPLGREPLTIGRSSESGLVIRDDYTSTHHARLMLWSDSWVIQDLDSTNGTFLNGARVTLPTPVPLNTAVRIGTTSFELRR